MSTLADFYNNPGNLRPPKGVTYEGQVGIGDGGFAIFENKNYGRQALVNDIKYKIEHGVDTPHSFIDKYSPAGDNPEDARDNYKIHLLNQLGLNSTGDKFPKDSYEKIADAITQFEGGTRGEVNNQGSGDQSKSAASAASSAASSASPSTDISDEDPSKFEQGVTLGAVGAGAGALLGLTPKVQIPFKLASAYLNREAPATVQEPVTPKGMTPEGYPVSEYEPKPQTSKPSTARTTAQDRIELGGTDEETGTSGRQRQTGYQIRTAQEAARAEEARKTAQRAGLDPNKPLAQAPDMTATNRGTAVPKTTQEQIQADELRKQNIQQRTADLKRQHTERVVKSAGQEWQQLAARADEMKKSPDPVVRGKAQAVMNEAIRLWNEGSKFAKTPATFGASVGAGAGFSAPYALEKYQEGDTSGALRTLGTGIGAGAALATVPRRAVPAVNFALSGADALNRLENKDYVGAFTSGLGAIAPYAAPFALGPQVGIPVGLATAVGAPVANYVKDKYFPYKSVLEQPQ